MTTPTMNVEEIQRGLGNLLFIHIFLCKESKVSLYIYIRELINCPFRLQPRKSPTMYIN